jgi:hypothetical protein
MELTDLEKDFLKTLLDGPWLSPRPSIMRSSRASSNSAWSRVPLQSGEIEYRITETGRAALR